MNKSYKWFLTAATSLAIINGAALAASFPEGVVSDEVIALERVHLDEATHGVGFCGQAPRDIDSLTGDNIRTFQAAPASTEMNLCNIHFHESAEHKGGEFTKYAGNGDGYGHGSGFVYSGHLSDAELAPVAMEIGGSEHGNLVPGDTIEVHYAYSTAQVMPGPTLGSCLSAAVNNPQLRVEAQVYVLVNDDSALNFMDLTAIGETNGVQQALNIPSDTGTPIQYAGSTTGPEYNEKGSPFHVTWSVRPQVAKVNIVTVGEWLNGNVFDEDHAHAVRNLVENPDLLSPITQ